jgi:hypothetical protein
MQYLLRSKIKNSLLLVVGCLLAAISFAQDDTNNQEDHDNKPIHFGINLGYNKSHFQFTHNAKFLNPSPDDTIQVVESINSSGINLAWLVNFRISEHFDLRMHPLDLTFTEKAFLYDEKYPSGTQTEKKIQSITLSFPVHLAFSSDRINNFKVYALAGGKADYDMASNAGARKAESLIKLYKVDVSVEVGMGFHFYFPYFVLSPEIKLSNGLRNLHSYDANLRYSNVIDKIKSKMITFSLTVE